MPPGDSPAKPPLNTPAGYKYPEPMSSISARLAVAFVAVGAAVWSAACSGSPAVSDQSGPVDPRIPEHAVITGEPAGYNSDDVAFASNMIADHRQAIELLKLVPERSTNPALAALASEISAVQQPEINILKVLLVQWNENVELGDEVDGEERQAGPTPAMPVTVDDATMTKLASLRGAEFDALWLKSMISHHQGSLEIANAEIADGANADARALAKTMAAQQEAEIEQMKKMLEGGGP